MSNKSDFQKAKAEWDNNVKRLQKEEKYSEIRKLDAAMAATATTWCIAARQMKEAALKTLVEAPTATNLAAYNVAANDYRASKDALEGQGISTYYM